VVPFEIAFLAVVNFHGNHLSTQQEHEVLLFVGADFLLVIPLVSALQAHAVKLIGQGQPLRVVDVFRSSFRTLATVVAASIIAAIGIGVGFLLFIPGLWLLLRLYVVAQTAAIEGTDWPTTLRRGFSLTRGNALRILGMLLILALINLTISSVLVGAAGSGTVGDVVSVVLALLLQSFSALLGALLYFDLRAREQLAGRPA